MHMHIKYAVPARPARNIDMKAHAQKRYRHNIYTHRENLVRNHEPRAKALGNNSVLEWLYIPVYNSVPEWLYILVYNSVPEWFCIILYISVPEWLRIIMYDSVPFRHANVHHNVEPFWHAT